MNIKEHKGILNPEKNIIDCVIDKIQNAGIEISQQEEIDLKIILLHQYLMYGNIFINIDYKNKTYSFPRFY